MTGLESLRERVDQADEALLEALAQRMEVVEFILREKEAKGLPLFDEEREAALLSKMTRRATERQLNPRLVERVLREVIQHSREVQARRVQEERNPELKKAARVAFQGVKGAYSWLACRKHFGEPVEPVGYPSFGEAFKALEGGQVDLGLLPVENALAGSIYEVHDLLAASRLHVVGEEVLKIDHCLIGLPGASIDQIHTVLSHPVALAQCVAFTRSLPNAACQSYVDSADAVRRVKVDGDPSQAAIASREAARLYGLEVLRDRISDHPENYTRFWVLSREPVQVDPRIPAKTSLLLVTEHREGALVSCLTSLARHGVNMTKLESRPRKGAPWQYQFHLDMEGNVVEERMIQALDEIRSRARVMRLLGCYPRADSQPTNGSGKPVAAALPQAAPKPPSETSPLSSRRRRGLSTVVWAGETAIGEDGFVTMVALDPSLTPAMMSDAAGWVKECGGQGLRIGSRFSSGPYGLPSGALTGLEALGEAARVHGLFTTVEVAEPEQIGPAARVADLLEIGARNMQNFPLLSRVAKIGKPILLTRGMTSTVEELLAAAEFVLSEGNQQVVLCDRGIRTFETAADCTLDLAALVALKDQTHLPVVVDPSLAAGTASRVPALARAVRVAGADAMMVELQVASGSNDQGRALTKEELKETLQTVGIGS